jgi:hypothetical protein
MAGSKQYGLTAAYGAATFDAAAKARASALRRPAGVCSDPDAIGFITDTRRPCLTSAFTSDTDTRVFPTPVSVPVTKMPVGFCFMDLRLPILQR